MACCKRILALIFGAVAAGAASLPDTLADAHRRLRMEDVAGAAALAQTVIALAPESAPVQQLLGELHFRQGDIVTAQMEFQKASTLDPKMARAWWGLGRVADCNSLHRTADNYYSQAHDMDPSDPDILYSFAQSLKPSEHVQAMRRYLTLADHYAPPRRLEDVRRHIEVDEKIGDRELGRLTSPYQRTEIPLYVLAQDGRNIRGFALVVSIHGSRPLRLLLDTGAGGIILNSKAAQRAGVEKLGGTAVRGIGDEGDRDSFGAVASDVRIADVAFADYLVDVSSRSSLYGEDGIIGTDVFADFLVTLDFGRRKLILDPLPGGRPEPDKRYDREIGPQLAGFTPVMRMSHLLLVGTNMGVRKPVLFVLDTGASSTMVSSRAASQATKVHEDSNTRLRGASGSVQHVARAEEVLLEFAGFHQKNQNLIALDLNNLSKEAGVEISGLLGISLLQSFTLSLDYRDGLVKFESAVR